MKELFTIGEIAGLFQLNIRTLRYYDSIGLLRPEKTDARTGYRYYSTRQFERLNTIKYLRALNMPLEKILHFFENKDTNIMLSILGEQLEETRRQIDRLQRIERKLNRRLVQLNDAMYSETGKITCIHIPERQITFLRKEIALGDDLEYPLRELEQTNHLEPAIFLGKVGLSISQENLMERRYDNYSGIFVFLEAEDHYQGEYHALPESDYVAVRFSGTHQGSGPYYDQLLEYMKHMGLCCCGDSVEITWIDSGFTDDTSQYITELQIPVK